MKYWKNWMKATVCLLLASGMCLAEERTNVALEKSYTLAPRPGYSHCTDAGDAIQLTDGQTTSDYFWTQKGTVGWVHVPYATITLDLGEATPISGLEFTTAAGVAGVRWPLAVFVHLSEDGKTYYQGAELVSATLAQNGPFPDGYSIQVLKSGELAARARYVRILAIATGSFVFCDEIRVWRGEDALLNATLDRTPVESDPVVFFRNIKARLCLEKRFSDDLAAVRRAVEAADAPGSEQLRADLTALETQLRAESTRSEGGILALDPSARAVLPLNDFHAEIYGVQARLWNAAGCPDRAWEHAGIWDWADRFRVPTPAALKAPSVNLTMLRNEPRAAAVNLYNASAGPLPFCFRFEWQSGPAPEVEFYQAVWTDTSEVVPVLAALEPVTPDAQGAYRVTVPPGLVGQIWLVFRAAESAAGALRCESVEEGACPVAIHVLPQDFPAKTTLHLGGWDYTNGRAAYNVNERNRASFLKMVQSRHVNAPWGTSSLLEKFTVNEDLSVTLDTAEFDAWLESWPPELVSEYFIFLGKGGWSGGTAPSFRGFQVGTPEFRTVVANLYAAWRAYWVEKNLDPGRFNVLIHDEPNESCKDFSPFVAWSEAIHAGCPELKVWEDPCFKAFGEDVAPRAFFEACDVLCPNRPMWLSDRKGFEQFYLAEQARGRTLQFYSCSGPMKLLDPYSYVLLQAWHAARIGANASFFWAMGDGGGATSWNEYYLGRNAYSPLFIDPESETVTLGKHLEAMRESAQDYEYCRMFREWLGTLRDTDPERADRLAAEWELRLETVLRAPGDGVLQLIEAQLRDAAQTNTMPQLNWSVPRDRTATDALRLWMWAETTR